MEHISEQAVSAAFTGHRFILYDKVSQLREALREIVTEHYSMGVRNFYCGMAIGFDLLAAEVVLSVKESCPDIKLIAVIPFREQCKRFTPYNQVRYQSILGKADRAVVLNETYVNGCFFQRNDYMLSHSGYLIAYFDGQPKGGTFYTVKRARQRMMPVVNLF